MFEGKVAVVTGAAQGIGEAAARVLAEHGAKVVLGDLLASVESVADDIGGRALVGNVADPDYCRDLVDVAMEQFGRLDFAINNAGIGGKQGPMEEIEPQDWARVIDVNLNGVFYGIKHQIPAMLKSGGGVIVNMASVLGMKPIPGHSLSYTAAKHGVIGLTRQVAVNFGGEGIRCNAICPGFIETAVTAEGSESNTGHAGTDWFVDRTPLGRTGQTVDIANIVKVLCSDDASFVNGASLQVDGGFVLT
jgi:NAD(P)-dependent dehydrogenase (short-subunit alcohol dehydrogenase family)